MILGKPLNTLSPARPAPVVEFTKTNPATQTVLLIHGTSANRKVTTPDWWHVGSDFCCELDSLLQQEGLTARCWSHLERSGWHQPFAWTGANSELARFTAGKALAEQIARLEEDAGIERYHVIGHSHGGNVILLALRSLKFTPRKLGAVIFMGTPVLHFRHPEDFDVRWIAFPIYLAALTLCAWGFPKLGHNVWLITATIAIFLALLAEIFFVQRRAARSEKELYGSGKPSAFTFDDDEAMKSLRAAENIVREPSPFVRQFTETEIKPHAFTPLSPNNENFSSRAESMVKEAGAYRLFQKVLNPPTFSSLIAKQEKPGPVSPLARASVLPPGLAAENTGLLATVENSFPPAKAVRYFAACVVAAMAILPACVMLIAEMIFKGLKRVISWIPRSFWWIVLKCSPLVVSYLIRLAALGADKGKFLRLEKLPPGVSQPEIVTDHMQKELADLYQALGANAGRLVLPALIHDDVFSIKQRVENSLSDLAIVHSQYYRSREVRGKIAKLIRAAEIRWTLPHPLFNSPGLTAVLDRIKNSAK